MNTFLRKTFYLLSVCNNSKTMSDFEYVWNSECAFSNRLTEKRKHSLCVSHAYTCVCVCSVRVMHNGNGVPVGCILNLKHHKFCKVISVFVHHYAVQSTNPELQNYSTIFTESREFILSLTVIRGSSKQQQPLSGSRVCRRNAGGVKKTLQRHHR